MRTTVIVNPNAGPSRQSAIRRPELARQLLAAKGVDGEVRETTAPGHASEIARDAVARGASLVCAWGGDGTINEVVAALAFGPAAMGIIPGGSGNGLARALGLPLDPAAALARALESPERKIDLGEMDGRLLVNVGGIGLDACIAVRHLRSGRHGLLPYAAFTTREACSYRPRDYEIETEAGRVSMPALVIALANSRQYGNGVLVAPGARIDDGLLDLVVIGPRPLWRLAWDARRLFAGTIDRAPGVTVAQVRQVTVESDEPMLFHVDGEPVQGGRRLNIRVHPGALRVRA